MTSETILKRTDGSKIKISASLQIDSTGAYTRVTVFKCLPGKRTFVGVVNSDDYQYRGLTMAQRRAFDREINLQHVSPNEVTAVLMALRDRINVIY